MANDFIAALRRVAVRARDASDWPRDLLAPRRVRVTAQACGSRHDAACCDEVCLLDGLQQILYANDRVAINGETRPSDPRDKPARVEITVELLEVRTPAELERIRDRRSVRLL